MFQETRKEMKEMSQETKEEMREMSREADKRKKEMDRLTKELEKQMKETDRRIGELGNRFGELAEHLVVPSMKEKFKARGLTFEQVSQNIEITDSKGNFLAEIDILLENGDIAIAVEVKAKALEKDVDKHMERMEVLRTRANKRNDNRKFRGAIAGAIMTAEVRNYAHKAGFYVIEQTGDTVKISIPKGFIPRDW